MNLREKVRGFTLVELLIVIAIIAVLSSIIVVSLNTSRVKARDAVRLKELRALHTALELYRGANGGNVPAGVGNLRTSSVLDPLISAGYIRSIPSDPVYTSDTTGYYYRNANSNGSTGSADTNSSTYYISFTTEAATTLGPAGRYCLTTSGIEAAGDDNLCTQK